MVYVKDLEMLSLSQLEVVSCLNGVRCRDVTKVRLENFISTQHVKKKPGSQWSWKICQNESRPGFQSRNSHWWKQQEIYNKLLDKPLQPSPNIPKCCPHAGQVMKMPSFPHHLHTVLQPVVLHEVSSTPLWGGCCCAWSPDGKGAGRSGEDALRPLAVGWGKRAGKRSRLERSKWEPAASGKKPPCTFSFETQLVAFWWCYHVVLPLMVVVLAFSNYVPRPFHIWGSQMSSITSTRSKKNISKPR